MKRWKLMAATIMALGISLGTTAFAFAQEKEYSGAKSEGVWISDKQEGPGRIYYKNGRIFEGFYVHGLLEGTGITYEKDGSKSIMTYYEDKANGLGITIAKDGTATAGILENHEWKKNVTLENWEGNKGIQFYAKKKTDINDGKAIAVYTNGAVYIGDFKNGKRDGWGTVYYSDERWYMGEWQNDLRNGVGYLSFAKDSDYLYKTGIWTDDKTQGSALYYDKKDSVLISQQKDSQANGLAVLIKSDGTKTLCEYKEGKVSNKNPDIYTASNGTQFVGVPDGKTGSGLKITKEGTTYIGSFTDGKADGEIFTCWPDSQVCFQGTYKAGKRSEGVCHWLYGAYYKGTYRNDDKTTYDKGCRRTYKSYSDGTYNTDNKLVDGTYTTYNKDGSSTVKTYKDGKAEK